MSSIHSRPPPYSAYQYAFTSAPSTSTSYSFSAASSSSGAHPAPVRHTSVTASADSYTATQTALSSRGRPWKEPRPPPSLPLQQQLQWTYANDCALKRCCAGGAVCQARPDVGHQPQEANQGLFNSFDDSKSNLYWADNPVIIMRY